MPHFVAFHMGLHCLPKTHLQVSNIKKFMNGVSQTLSAFHCNANLVKICRQVHGVSHIQESVTLSHISGDNVAVYYRFGFKTGGP